jgi:hypothetical protein
MKRADYLDMEKRQQGKCAICGKHPDRLQIDHDHSQIYPVLIRGLLCHSCNTLLGRAKDDVEILKSAISYIRKWRKYRENNS